MSVLRRWAIPGPQSAERAAVLALTHFFCIYNGFGGGTCGHLLNSMRISVLLWLIMATVTAWAQDVIYRTDGSKIDAKVENINKNAVSYKIGKNLQVLSLSQVWRIVYADGTEVVFNKPSVLQNNTEPQSSQISSYYSGTQSRQVSDVELLLHEDRVRKSYSKAKKYRATAIVGGVAIVAGGVVLGVLVGQDNGDYSSLGYITAPCVVVGSLWWWGFNSKANSIERQAKMMEMRSMSLFEEELLHKGKCSLNGGLSLINSEIVKTPSLGINLKYMF